MTAVHQIFLCLPTSRPYCKIATDNPYQLGAVIFFNQCQMNKITCVYFWGKFTRKEAFKDNVWDSCSLSHLCYRICKAPHGGYFEGLGSRMKTTQSKVSRPHNTYIHTANRQYEHEINLIALIH